MIIYVNDKNEIKAVGSTTDESLIEIELDDEGNPFEGWTEKKICCYKVLVEDGRVQMMAPYIDSRLLSTIESIGTSFDNNQIDIYDIQDALVELASVVYELEE